MSSGFKAVNQPADSPNGAEFPFLTSGHPQQSNNKKASPKQAVHRKRKKHNFRRSKAAQLQASEYSSSPSCSSSSQTHVSSKNEPSHIRFDEFPDVDALLAEKIATAETGDHGHSGHAAAPSTPTSKLSESLFVGDTPQRPGPSDPYGSPYMAIDRAESIHLGRTPNRQANGTWIAPRNRRIWHSIEQDPEDYDRSDQSVAFPSPVDSTSTYAPTSTGLSIDPTVSSTKTGPRPDFRRPASHITRFLDSATSEADLSGYRDTSTRSQSGSPENDLPPHLAGLPRNAPEVKEYTKWLKGKFQSVREETEGLAGPDNGNDLHRDPRHLEKRILELQSEVHYLTSQVSDLLSAKMIEPDHKLVRLSEQYTNRITDRTRCE